MRATLLCLAVAVAAVAVMPGSSLVWGEDVKVHVIEGEKPPTGETAKPQTDNQAAGQSSEATELAGIRDSRVRGMLGRLNLNAEQVKAVNAEIERYGAEQADAREKAGAKFRELREKLQGVERGSDEYNKIREEMGAAYAGMRDQYTEGRTALLDRIGSQLTPEQAARLKEMRENWDTPQARAGRQADEAVGRLFRGIDLSDAQSAQVKAVVARKLEAAYQKEAQNAEQIEKLRSQMRDAWRSGDREKAGQLREQLGELTPDWRTIYREARDEVTPLLTAEQKQKIETARQERRTEWNQRTVGMATRGLDDLNLTDAQKQQVTDLQKAAEGAMAELEFSDWEARRELSAKLREDIAKVLNEDQQKKFTEAGQRQGGRRGWGQRNRDGDRNRDGNRNRDGGRRNRDDGQQRERT